MFGPAQAIADAVLYEGYVLYPYRASADKNRIRWQWGVVGPRDSGGVGEDPTMAAGLVVEAAGDAVVHLRLRFLQVVNRQVEALREPDLPSRVESLVIGGVCHVSFDDSVERVVDAEVVVGTGSGSTTVPFTFDARTTHEPLGAVDGVHHRETRRHETLTGTLAITTTPADDVHLVHVAIENTTRAEIDGTRDEANLRSLVGAHVLAAVDGGQFISTLDPPDERRDVVGRCTPHRLWPVLVGAQQRSALVLASPVILYDQPEIAPESNATFFDGLEIDEMLILRVMTMTDDEKAEARATDPRSAAIIDRVDALPDDEMASVHGAMRTLDGRPVTTPEVGTEDFDIPTISTDGKPWWDPAVDERFDPDTDGVVVAGEAISRGSVVRLRPSRRADAHDIFLRDQVATVRAIVHDVDGSVHIAVTVDEDPAADINDETGRYLYFAADEVEPLGRRVGT